jgi:hypothetical protein
MKTIKSFEKNFALEFTVTGAIYEAATRQI